MQGEPMRTYWLEGREDLEEFIDYTEQ